MGRIVFLLGAVASRGKRDAEGNIIEGLPITVEIPGG